MQKKVLVVQKYIAHFRIPVFQKLQESDEFDFLFLSATSTYAPKSMDSLEKSKLPYEELKFFSLKRFIFLSGINPKKRKADIVLLEGSLNILSNLPFMLKCRLQKIPVVLWTKGLRQNRQPRRGLNRLYEKCIHALASRFVVYGQMSRDDLISKGIPSEKIFVAQNTVKVDHLLSLPNKNDQLEGKPLVFGYMGRLDADKQVLSIIKAFQLFLQKSESRDHQLLIAGSGPEQQNLERYVKDQNLLESVHFLGRVPDEEVASFFDKIHVYTSFAAHGLGIIEAMAAAKVILITPEFGPETEGIIHMETGFVSELIDKNSFVTIMVNMDKNRKILNSVSKSARLVCQSDYTLISMVSGLEQALNMNFSHD